jgi:hypothetical protein
VKSMKSSTRRELTVTPYARGWGCLKFAYDRRRTIGCRGSAKTTSSGFRPKAPQPHHTLVRSGISGPGGARRALGAPCLDIGR